MSVGLVWESAKSGVQHIRDVVNYCIGTTLDLTEVRIYQPLRYLWTPLLAPQSNRLRIVLLANSDLANYVLGVFLF